MGRSIHKRSFGNNEKINLQVNIDDGSGGIIQDYIYKQKGRNKFLLNGGKTVRLVNKDSGLATDEAFLQCMTPSGDVEFVSHISQHIVHTFGGSRYNRHKWVMGVEPTDEERRLMTSDEDDPLSGPPPAEFIPVDWSSSSLYYDGDIFGDLGFNVNQYTCVMHLVFPEFTTERYSIFNVDSGADRSIGYVSSETGKITGFWGLADNSNMWSGQASGLLTAGTPITLMISATSYDPVFVRGRHMIFEDDRELRDSAFFLGDTGGYVDSAMAGHPDTEWAIGDRIDSPGWGISPNIQAFYLVNQYIDLSVEANRRLFVNSDGTPTDWSEAPEPQIMISGGPDKFNAGTNDGTGPDFTRIGPAFT